VLSVSILQDVDDSVEFKKLCSALTTLGVGADIRKHLWRLLASLLHMGNVKFVTRLDEEITTTADHKVYALLLNCTHVLDALTLCSCCQSTSVLRWCRYRIASIEQH
jgi:myosin heavy subunit